MPNEIAHVALHDDRDSIVHSAVQTARELSGSDIASAAIRDETGTAYQMDVLSGIIGPRFGEISVLPGRGLGGQVLAEQHTRTTNDYLSEPSITEDYRAIVAEDGLRGIACTPIGGPDGPEALLYIGRRQAGAPGGRVIAQLERVAEAAGIGLHHAAARARERELAVLRERQALASELHDSVAQSLFAIGIAAQTSAEGNDPELLARKLEEIEQVAARAGSELRTALARLSRAPERVAFEARFEAELRLFERRTGRRVGITRHGEPRDLGRLSEQLLIDSVREGLANAAKHSHGEVVLAHLGYQPECVLLSLQTELQASETAQPKSLMAPGSGLSILRERTEHMGGALELALDEDDVAVLRVEVPA
jgi:signal transduction histidine kinase